MTTNLATAATTMFGLNDLSLYHALWLAETALIFLAAVLLVLALAMAYSVHLRSKEGSKYVDHDELKHQTVPRESLFRLFQPHLVPIDEISGRGYSSVLSLVQELIGVQPSCDTVLEIWKPAFQCYNLIVPNFLNLPHLLMPGYGIHDLVSLAMYASSRANQCAYCTTHCCSFLLRRGVDLDVVMNSLDELLSARKEEGSPLQSRERAVVRVAYGLGTVPPTLQKYDVNALQSQLSPDQIEWIVAATAMFGSFNKLMDGLAIPLEKDAYAETRQYMDNRVVLKGKAASAALDDVDHILPPPPVDDWTHTMACVWQGIRPGGAIALDKKLMGDTPTSAEDCVAYLQKSTGARFSVLLELRHERFRRALTAILAKNLVSAGLSLRTKVLAGIPYCRMLENQQLESELQAILSNLSEHLPTSDSNEDLVLRAATALSYNPSRMTAPLIDEIEASTLTAENMVELVSFLATIQALHRVEVYYQVAGLQ